MSLLDYIFPKQCIFCSRVGFEICNPCLKKISKALPSCFVCKRINTHGLVHKGCLDTEKKIFWIRGWNPNPTYIRFFTSRKEKHLYSIYALLMGILIKERGKEMKVNVQPLTRNSLDIYLSKIISSYSNSEILCLVGEKISNRKELALKISRSKYTTVIILTLF
jgi:hypothetical protein